MSSSSSPLALLINLAAVGIFGYSVYFMQFDENLKKIHNLTPAPARKYGNLKFLTYQCLLIQLLNSILHVGAHFIKSLRAPRDLIFGAAAYPIGSIVVYTFWAVWHLMGREFIFPVAMDPYYPVWLNHVTHTIIAPLNIIMALLVQHKYSKFGAILNVCYVAFYVSLLYYIKSETGVFVYKYLDTMNDVERFIYFSITTFSAYLMYKSGQYLSYLAHRQPSQRPSIKKSKQK